MHLNETILKFCVQAPACASIELLMNSEYEVNCVRCPFELRKIAFSRKCFVLYKRDNLFHMYI